MCCVFGVVAVFQYSNYSRVWMDLLHLSPHSISSLLMFSFLFPPHCLIVSLNQFDRIEAFVPQESSQEDYDETDT